MPGLARRRFRFLLRSLADGCAVRRRRLRRRRLKPTRQRQNLARSLLRYMPVRVPALRPWAWALLHKLKTRTYSSLRMRVGFPARGQRTRSNAKTTRRVSDPAARLLRRRYWYSALWTPRRSPQEATSQDRGPKVKLPSRRALKAQRHKRGVIRTSRDKSV